ncbi:hypothetical protein [Alkalihalobacillus sp. AL-G]|uniref:hypothetical protein n=1 Tax=Alkalihalobacillus sp. AL-G TaxID=2926399 RepID=UPI00272D401D|nr:hypothetical protein [Alkalihalobacillus sp. AL-G]WLD91640.1 hypothetical protein MOJ78_11345 [Alkalihalobacillus sp. AL-G]
MREIPNFNEFYQRSLVLIGEADRLCVVENTSEKEHIEKFTHWLFTLEGFEAEKATGRYDWNVSVYPSKSCGGFDYKHPFLVSDAFQSIHEAIDFVKELELKAKGDMFCTVAAISE